MAQPAVAVSTRAFTARVGPDAGGFWTESVDLVHPGRLAASYCGFKAEVRLAPGHHVIRVEIGEVWGDDSVFTYEIDVVRGRR